jgi:hypothetical protein
MTVTICHNLNCDTSPNVLAMIRQSGDRHCERSEAIQGNPGHSMISGSPRRFAPRDDGGWNGQTSTVYAQKTSPSRLY